MGARKWLEYRRKFFKYKLLLAYQKYIDWLLAMFNWSILMFLLYLKRKLKKIIIIIKRKLVGAWVAQPVERLTLGFHSGHDFSSDHDLTVHGIKQTPHQALLALCPSPTHAHALSLKINIFKKKIREKKVKNRTTLWSSNHVTQNTKRLIQRDTCQIVDADQVSVSWWTDEEMPCLCTHTHTHTHTHAHTRTYTYIHIHTQWNIIQS